MGVAGARVARWGNSLAVRLPRAVVDILDLHEGDVVHVQVTGPRAFELERAPLPAEMLARLRKYRGRLPAGFTFDRLEAHDRG
jgi:antitoxin MazE